MRLILHTFKKDVYRFWPAAAVALALLAVVAGADSLRYDTIGSAAHETEGWLNLVVPLAWACLIALVVLEEPLSGDQHFWLTRPHRWPALLAAKGLFALLFVHLPAFAAQAYVLAAHGFSPFAALPELLARQLAIAAFLTLPALALSSLTRGFTHFMMGVFAVGAATVFTLASSQSRGVFIMARQDDDLRAGLASLLIAAGSLVVLWLQYRRRPAVLGRAAAVATVVLAFALLACVPWTADPHVHALLRPAQAPVTLRLDSRANIGSHYWSNSRHVYAVPLALSGLPAGTAARAGLLSLELVAPDGHRYPASLLMPNQQEKSPVEAALYPDVPQRPSDPYVAEPPTLALSLRLDPAVYDAIKDQHVRLTGQTVVRVIRLGETVWMPVGGRVAAPGVGHCSNSVGEDRGWEDRLNVLCESPGYIPTVVRVVAWTPEEGFIDASPRRLSPYNNYSSGPGVSELSPLDRARTSFGLSDPKYRRRLNSAGGVPLEHLSQARIAITPEFITGYSVARFDIPDVPLSKYWVEPTY